MSEALDLETPAELAGFTAQEYIAHDAAIPEGNGRTLICTECGGLVHSVHAALADEARIACRPDGHHVLWRAPEPVSWRRVATHLLITRDRTGTPVHTARVCAEHLAAQLRQWGVEVAIFGDRSLRLGSGVELVALRGDTVLTCDECLPTDPV